MAKEKQLCLSERLQALADMIPPGSRVADIGTDHGYLPIWLLQQGRASFAAACDVGEAPLAHARRSAAQFGLEDKINFRLGSGLSCLAPGEVDTIVIAGMGGETIAAILSEAPWAKEADRLLLQPMTKAPLLRAWLAENGYRFLKERLVYENHAYFPVLAVCGGGDGIPLTPGQAWGGVLLRQDPLQGAALEATIDRLSRALAGLEKASDPAQKVRSEEYRAALEQLRQMKEEWRNANCQGN